MSYFDKYIILIILVKIVFVILAASHLYFIVKGKEDSKTDKKIVHWKERVEFVFITLMSILLIYLFNPRSNRDAKLDFETKLLLYLFGFILLITAKWDIFIKESPIFKKVQSVV
jgi:hypothetical protein